MKLKAEVIDGELFFVQDKPRTSGLSEVDVVEVHETVREATVLTLDAVAERVAGLRWRERIEARLKELRR